MWEGRPPVMRKKQQSAQRQVGSPGHGGKQWSVGVRKCSHRVWRMYQMRPCLPRAELRALADGIYSKQSNKSGREREREDGWQAGPSALRRAQPHRAPSLLALGVGVG